MDNRNVNVGRVRVLFYGDEPTREVFVPVDNADMADLSWNMEAPVPTVFHRNRQIFESGLERNRQSAFRLFASAEMVIVRREAIHVFCHLNIPESPMDYSLKSG